MLGFLSFLISGNAVASFKVAPVLSVTRTAPVFKSPSSKSELLAEAEPGTPVLARALSPQGSWILVEDSDGHLGWMPTERTNYKQVSSVQNDVLPIDPSWSSESKEMPLPDGASIPAPTTQAPRSAAPTGWEISAAYRENISGESSRKFPLGVSFIELSPEMGEGVGVRADVDLGAQGLESWRVGFIGRYVWMGSFFRELDVGIERQKINTWRSGLSAGYALGFSPVRSFAFSLRGGLFWGSETQWNGEFRCRFAF